MAGGLNASLILLAGLLPGPSGAQALADPTRPPAEVAPAVESTGGAVAASGLQSVIMRKHGRPAALINGAVVELGGKVGEATLVTVGEDSVVLRGPEGEETMRLTPAAAKQLSKGDAAAAARKKKEAIR
ncbi:MAG: MSHA biogenesis protein MshK [Pseudomonadota bacterium]